MNLLLKDNFDRTRPEVVLTKHKLLRYQLMAGVFDLGPNFFADFFLVIAVTSFF